MAEEPQPTAATEASPVAHERLLVELAGLLAVKHYFHPGQIVCWKHPALQNRSIPALDQPAIVMRTIDPPLLAEPKDAFCPQFRETLDIVLGALDSNGLLCEYHYDSRRLRPWDAEALFVPPVGSDSGRPH
jgi:hypothetical protein